MGSFHAAILAACLCGGGESVLLEFYSDSCPPCRAMQPVVQQLEAKGYTIRKVNVQHEPAIGSRFGVRGIPCFVMLVDGREVDRVVGATSRGRLEQMLALARPSGPAIQPPAAVRPGSQPSTTWVAADDSSPGSVPLPAVISNTTFAATPPASRAPSGAAAASVAQGMQENVLSSSDIQGRLEADLIACTVRLRIEDAGGNSCGSGTIIDSRGGEALILTCGHLFRDSQGKGRIEVDLFGANRAERIPGELVHYDLEKDLGLLKIRVSGPVRAARMAPPGYSIVKGARVINVGCNNGDLPTVRLAHVTALDKFLGPSNIEVSGLPVQGRSGGGLFTADGQVIGVCNAAVPTDNEGLYASLASIHGELDQAQLPFVYRQPANKSGLETAVAATEPPTMPKRMPPPSDMFRLTEAPGQPAAPPAATQPESRSPLTPEEQAALEEIQRRKAEGAELICIIRSRTDPQARSEVIVLDRVSPAFLKQLTAEPPQRTPSRTPSEEPSDRGPLPANAAAPPAPTRPAGIPLGQTTDAGPAPATPSSDWHPRWLESGYQGS